MPKGSSSSSVAPLSPIAALREAGEILRANGSQTGMLVTGHPMILHMRHVVAIADAGHVIHIHDIMPTVDVYRGYLASQTGQTLDAAAGLQPRRGKSGWKTKEDRGTRNATFIKMDHNLFAHLNVAASTRAIVALFGKMSPTSCEAELLDQLPMRWRRAPPGSRQLKTIICVGRGEKS